MLGFELVENFKHPYMARNPSEFWRRWHVSFSTWIRDYLYIPLGGSRGTFASMTQATFGAMLLSGLWHGAAWTFVLWGAFHASLLTGYRLVVPRIPQAWKDLPGSRAAAIAIMFGFTNVGWLIFRETHIDRLLHYFTLSPFSATPAEWSATFVMLSVCAATGSVLVVAFLAKQHVLPRLEQGPWLLPVQTTLGAVAAMALFTFVRTTSNDFIYFQF